MTTGQAMARGMSLEPSCWRALARRVTLYGALLLLCLGAASGQLTLELRAGDVLRLAVEAGTVRLQVVTQHFHGPACAYGVWEEIFYPARVPDAGIRLSSAYRLDWALPGIHRDFQSVVGEWWTITLPIWFLTLITLLAARFARGRRPAPHEPGAPPTHAISVAGVATWPPTRWLAWTSAVVASLVLVLWLLSGIWWVTFSDGRSFHVDVGAGVISFATIPDCVSGFWADARSAEIHGSGEPFRLDWMLPHSADCVQSTIGSWDELNIPFWTVFLVACGPLLLTLRRRRPHRSDEWACRTCGYDLTGNVSGRCPECGTATLRGRAARDEAPLAG